MSLGMGAETVGLRNRLTLTPKDLLYTEAGSLCFDG